MRAHSVDGPSDVGRETLVNTAIRVGTHIRGRLCRGGVGENISGWIR